MKRNQPISSMLGLTQQYMAMLLNVSRSHYSLYELGKRSLPLHATQLLAEMLTHLQPTGESERRVQHVQQQARYDQLERLLRENEYQRLAFAKKVAAIMKKHTAQQKLTMLGDFLNMRAKGTSPQHVLIAGKAAQVTVADPIAELLHYELKQELLELEKLLLESKIRKIRQSLENAEDSAD
jgi:transcriptional regulator with XRE-family HTH domain